MRKYITLLFILLGILASANAQTGPVWGYVTPEIDINANTLQYVPGEGVYAGGWFSTPDNKIMLIKGTEVAVGSGGFPSGADGAVWNFLRSGINTYALSDIPGYYLTIRNSNTDTWDPVSLEIDGPLYGGTTLPDGRLVILGSQTLPYPKAFILDGGDASELSGIEIQGEYAWRAVVFKGNVYITYFSGDTNITAWNIDSNTAGTFVEPPSNQGINGIYADEDYMYIGMLSSATGEWEMWRYDGENWEYIHTFEFPQSNTGFTRDGDNLYAFGEGVWIYNIPSGEITKMTTTFEGQPVYDIEKDESTGILYFSMGQVAWYGIDTTDVSIIGTQPQNINVYPNPATDIVTIEIKNYGNLTIHNSLGQNIEPILLSSSSEKIILDVKNLPKGIYSVQTENSGGRFVARFIK